MKKSNILSVGLLAAAAAALLAPSAKAQNVYNAGDLILGFEKPGSSNNYVVDLGPASYFLTLSLTPGTTDITTALSLGNIAADLADPTNGFGSGWATDSLTPGSNVQWGIIGATDPFNGNFGLPASTLFETKGELVAGVQSTPPARHSSGLQGSDNTSNIVPFGNNFNGSAQTGNSNFAEFQNSSSTDNWSSANPSSNAFGTGNPIEQPASGNFIGPTTSVLDLYELKPGSGSGTDLGSFNLDSAGNLDFTSAAVPEPSTYAAIGMGAAFLLFFRRTRKSLHA
jgi:hypothetical protein